MKENKLTISSENASNLTHECFHDHFNNKILPNFLIKIVIKILCISKQNMSFIFSPKEYCI